MAGKRTDYISWDALFIGYAAQASWRSKDPRTQNGACIVTPDHKDFAIGYNGMPKLKNKDNDDVFPWIGEGEDAMTERYKFVIHAERNAMDNAKFNLEGSSLYLFSERGYYPCEMCCQGIVSKGIAEIVMAFVSNGKEMGASERYGNHAFDATIKMLTEADVRVRILGDDMVRYCLDFSRRFAKIADMLSGKAND